MISIVNKIRHHGLVGSARIIFAFWKKKIILWLAVWKCRNAPKYANPTHDELKSIERDLFAMGIKVEDFSPLPDEFRVFQEEQWFPADYHGGKEGGVWDEKLLEHWLSSKLLKLMDYDADDIYVDVAASSSPWVRSLRERTKSGAYAIDLSPVGNEYKQLPFYRVENATQTSFSECSVKGGFASLCFRNVYG